MSSERRHRVAPRYLKNEGVMTVQTFRKFLLAPAIGALLALGAGTRLASAAPVTFEFTLTANFFGDETPIVGFNSLPATPFVGRFTLDSADLAPNTAFSFVAPLDFALTIGTASFDETFVDLIGRETDASGAITRWTVFDQDSQVQLSIRFNDNGLEGWSVWEFTPPLVCGVSGVGRCFGGFGPDPGSGVVTFAQVPEPATLALLGLGLAGLGIARRRVKFAG